MWKLLSHVQFFGTPWTIQPMEFSRPEYQSGYHSPLQGIFPTQVSNPGLLHCRRILYQLSHQKWSEVKSLSHVPFFATPWTVAHQAPLSIGFSRQEYWSGLPFPSPGDLPNPGIKPRSHYRQTLYHLSHQGSP